MFVRTIRGLVAATLLVAAAATVAEAQMESASRFSLNAGISNPMGDFGDFADLGFTVGGAFTTGLGQKLNLRINVDLSRYGLPNSVDGNWMLIGGMANVVLPFTTTSEFKPYVLAGAGMTNWKLDVTGSGTSDGTDLTINGGVGFNFNMGGKAWFTELRYVTIQSDGSSIDYLPIVLGIKF